MRKALDELKWARQHRVSTPSMELSRAIMSTFARLSPTRERTEITTTAQHPSQDSKRIMQSNEMSSSRVSPALLSSADAHHSRAQVDAASTMRILNDPHDRLERSFVDKLQFKIDRELRILAKQRNPINPEERVRVFQSVAADIASHFKSSSALLERIFTEYNTFIECMTTQSQQWLERERSWLRDRRATEDELTRTQRELALLKENEAKRRVLVESSPLIEKSVPLLIEYIHDLEKRFAEEKNARLDLESKLNRTALVSSEFHDTLLGLERNFQAVILEKDATIRELRGDVQRLQSEWTTSQQKSIHDLSTLEDKLTGQQILIHAREQQLTLFAERIRHLEARVLYHVNRFTDLDESHRILEDRLERLNKPTTLLSIRDPTMTPRPNKADIISRVPSLGSLQQYKSTQSIINALTELTSLNAATIASQSDFINRLETLIADRMSAFRHVDAQSCNALNVQNCFDRAQ